MDRTSNWTEKGCSSVQRAQIYCWLSIHRLVCAWLAQLVSSRFYHISNWDFIILILSVSGPYISKITKKISERTYPKLKVSFCDSKDILDIISLIQSIVGGRPCDGRRWSLEERRLNRCRLSSVQPSESLFHADANSKCRWADDNVLQVRQSNLRTQLERLSEDKIWKLLKSLKRGTSAPSSWLASW